VTVAHGAAPAGTCEDARARASLALDGELPDDASLVLLHRHLARCAECRELVDGMRSVSGLIRAAPLEPLGRGVARSHLRRARVPTRRLQWAWAAAAVAALTIGTASFPGAGGEAPRPASGPTWRTGGAPPRLPLGQRSAADDFVPAGGLPGVVAEGSSVFG
jgi:predicted anti-sigma-YlaC factor YlaD